MKYENREVVLKVLVGSHNYNLNTPASDEDFKLFVAPTFEDLYHGRMFATAKQSDTLDYDVHDIRQLGNLLWKANINFIEVLFSKKVEVRNPELLPLFMEREKLAAMNLPGFYNATMGMHRQKMSELHKGTEKTKVLLENFGYDTKQACHALRCLYVLAKYKCFGCGSMSEALWFETDTVQQRMLLDVKNGEVSETDFLRHVELWHQAANGLKEWYYDFEPDTALKEELDAKIMQFVKAHL